MLAATLGNYSCEDSYSLDEDQPSNLNSIYGYMEEQGNFTNFLQLIDDLGHKETLSKTGSKTLFVADDAAFAEFFKSNDWGVTKYADLSTAQKKLLLNAAMIDNPYPTSMLSSALGPVKGEVCRRTSSQSIYDSIQVIYKKDYEKEFPLYSDAFNSLLSRDSIVLFKDGSGAAPMIHFNAQFISGNKLQSTDIDFLYNQTAGTRKSDDVYVNNSKVINDQDHMNVFCKNGFVHVVDKVITPLDNMSEIIRKGEETSIYRDIIERFAVPMDSGAMTTNYNANKGLDITTKIDTVFLKRYYSKRSMGSTETTRNGLTKDRSGNLTEASLKFDPGWNTYVCEIPSDRVGMMEDMAVMLVPSNAAMQTWWNKEGKVIQDYYAPGISDASLGLPKVPRSVIAELVNVNMLNSMNSSLPSRFDDVLNDANEPLGITLNDVDKVKLGCNGAIYVTNQVFAPTSYSSVLFPAVVDTTNFKIIKQAIDNLEYDAYLNSMVSTYSFFIPTNKGMLQYVDPMSFGQTEAGQSKYQMWEFSYNPDASSTSNRIEAKVYNCLLNEDGSWEKDGEALTTITKQSSASFSTAIGNRLYDMLDNIIVTEALVPGKFYYKTKGNNFVKISGDLDTEHQMYASGSWQIERNKPVKIGKIFEEKNGKAYILADDQEGTSGLLMGTSMSVAKQLQQHEEFSEFLALLKGCGALATSNPSDKWAAGDQQNGNLMAVKAKGSSKYSISYLLNAYHYTIYAPTNTAMEKAYEMGLPTLDMLEEAELLDAEEGVSVHADSIKSVMLDFVKYHIQDNAIFVDNGFDAGRYESGKTELIPSVDENFEKNGNYSPGRPYKITVDPSASGITVTDNFGQCFDVSKEEGLFNIYAREYWYDGTTVSNPYSATLNNSSAAVIHGIDTPLIYNYPNKRGMSEEEFQAALQDPDQNQFLYKERTITNDSAIKNRSPRKVR